MKILYGIGNNALLQRDESNACICTFGAECAGIVKASLGTVESIGENTYALTGIPAGGPYAVTLSDDESSVELTLWVGDIWLLGGQSNMEGAGCFTEEDHCDEAHPDDNIRAYFSDNRWGAAVPLLHEPWNSVDACQRDVWVNDQLNSPWKTDKPEFTIKGVLKRGIGPGLTFAKKMYEFAGVPQAVIPCALGGSCMAQWSPDGENNLYRAMIGRVKRIGGKVRGLFWYQGCSDCSTDGALHYTERMNYLISSVRRDCGDEKLPVVIVQLSTNNLPWGYNTVESGMLWESIRDQQRVLSTAIPHTDTVAAIDGEHEDLIHLSSSAQKKVGLRGALSMAHLCGTGGAPAPRIRKMSIRRDEGRPFWCALDIEYDNITELVSNGNPAGFTITERPDELVLTPNCRIAKTKINGNTVSIYTELDEDALKEHYIRYGYLNMGVCTIGDKNGHHLLAFGPHKISDYIKE